jgi:uncharacterized membrane protein YebE (DUF533 family)
MGYLEIVPARVVYDLAMDDLRIFRLWAAAAWADGVIHPAEAAALQRWLDAAEGMTPDARKEAARMIAVRPEVDPAEVNALSTAAREGVYRAALAISALDGKVVTAERDFLERLRTVLKIDPKTLERILTQFTKV